MKKNKSAPRYIRAVGRRKTASCVVKLFRGRQAEKPILVNGLAIQEYWPSPNAKATWEAPFKTTNTANTYTAEAIVRGSGKQAQLGAFVHAAARALDKSNSEKFHPILKKRGFLTRDSRMKERRKPGLAQKARAKKQSPKR